MKKILTLLSLIFIVGLLSGCKNNNDLKQAYNKMKINSKNINGYNMSIRLFGINNDTKINESAFVTNYMNESYLVKLNNVYYYVTDKGNFKVNVDNKKDSTKNDKEEYTGEVPFLDTLNYLKPLKNNKADDKAVDEVIDDVTYKTYTFKLNSGEAERLLKNTSLEKETVTGTVYGKVYIDENGYVYKLEYDYSSAFKNSNNLKLVITINSIDKVKEINMYE